MYENGKLRLVETILRLGEGRIKENDGGMNSNKIYYKHFYKCHSVSPAQQYDNNFFKK
jgi:hypothetical protein